MGNVFNNRKVNLLDIEKSLLSLIISKNNVIEEVISIISKEDFENSSDIVNKTVFDLCVRCYNRYKYVSTAAVVDEIRNAGISKLVSIQDMDIKTYVQSLSRMFIQESDHIVLAKILKDASVRRKMSIAVSDIQTMLSKSSFSSPQETIAKADRIYMDCVNSIDRGDDVPVNIFDDFEKNINNTKNQDFSIRGYPGPHPKLQKIYGSLLRPGNISLITSRSGVGKSLANFEKIAMADGSFREIGSCYVGQKVISRNGNIATIEGVYPQGLKRCLSFEYEDGRNKTICCVDHLWSVLHFDANGMAVEEVISAKEIHKMVMCGQKVFLPTFSIFNSESAFNFEEFIKIESEKVPDDITKEKALGYLFKRFFNNKNFYLGIGELKNPSFQIKNKIGARNKSYMMFTTESKEDSYLLKEIIVKMGGVCIISENKNIYILKIILSPLYKMIYSYNKDGCFKRSYSYLRKRDYISISSVKEVGYRETTCIMVSDDSHLFGLKNNVLTHNTQFTMDYCRKVSEAYNVPLLHIDNGEMSKEELQYRMASSFSQMNYFDIESGRWSNSVDGISKMKRAILATKDKKIFYYQSSGKSIEQIKSVIKRFYEVYCKGGQMYVCYDYIKPPINGTNRGEEEHAYIGRLVDNLKRLVQDEIKLNGKPVVSIMTSVQSNKTGVVSKKSSSEIDDSENVFGLSDRILHFCSQAFILRTRTHDDINLYGKNFGSHIMIGVKGRHLGEDPNGYLKLVETKNGIRKNAIGFSFKNFTVTEAGDLREMEECLKVSSSKMKESQGEKDKVPF